MTVIEAFTIKNRGVVVLFGYQNGPRGARWGHIRLGDRIVRPDGFSWPVLGIERSAVPCAEPGGFLVGGWGLGPLVPQVGDELELAK